MSKNYFVYPCETMRITQSYTGSTSHLPHMTGSPKDYPIDEGCKNVGRDWMICPCDKMKIKRIYGVANGGINTIWLESTSKVCFADGTKDYATLLVTHPNDDDLKKLKVGQTFKRGQKICREGSDGASGNHFHFSAGKGKVKGTGWALNSKNKWVLTTTKGTFKPEKLFYVDTKLTDIESTNGVAFVKLNAKKTYVPGNYIVNKLGKTETLNVRTGAGTKYPKLKFNQLSKSAQSKILKLKGKKVNGYVKNLTCTVSRVVNNWGKTPSGWICLDYCSLMDS